LIGFTQTSIKKVFLVEGFPKGGTGLFPVPGIPNGFPLLGFSKGV